MLCYFIIGLPYQNYSEIRAVIQHQQLLFLWPTWIEPMVVINSQPWGIGHWFVFKRVCVHCIGMKGTYFSDSFLITYIYQLPVIPKRTHQSYKQEGQHPNGTSDYKDKTKLTSTNSRKACVFRSVSVSKLHVCF